MAKAPKTENQKVIQHDLLRYKKNKLASSLALLGLVFNCLYFCLLYGFTDRYFGTWRLGISVILTLFSLLIIFLGSEGIKNYNKKYAFVLVAVAAVQIIRIFGLPLEALLHDLAESGEALSTRYFGIDMTSWACYVMLVIWLCASAASLIAAAVIGYINCTKLENFNKKLEAGEVSVEETLKAMDAEDAVAKTAEAEQPVETTQEVQ